MKRFFTLLSVFVLLVGCAYRGKVLQVEPYKTTFIASTPQHQKIYIQDVKDTRANKSIIAVVTNSDGDDLGYDTSSTDFVKWYKDALKKSLKANGYEVVKSPKNAQKKITLQLKNLLVTFNKSNLTKANLFGYIKLKLIIQQNNQTITKQISERIKNYTPLIADTKDFKKEIKTLLNDSVKMIVKGLR